MSEAFLNKNIELSLQLDNYLAKHPILLDKIPNGAYVVITIKNDKKFNEDSLSLIRDKRRKKIVEAHKSGKTWSIRSLESAAI